MKVTNEKIENRQAFLKIEMEPHEVEESTETSYRRLVQKVDVPGFRKGKAPRAVFERHFGKHRLFHEMLDDLVPEAYKKAIAEQKLEPIAEPQIELAEEAPVILKAVVPLKPVVNLGDYNSIDMQPQPAEVSEDMVNSVIEQLRHQHATWEPAERPIDFNDSVTLDVESTMGEEPFINQKGVQYQIVKDFISPAPGFPEQLVGMKKDEEKEFKLQYPADYPRTEVAGKEATFKVKVTEIKQEVMPEVNDAFATQINPETTSMEVLRQKINDDLKQRVEERVKSDFEDKVVEAATAMSSVEYPPVLLEAEIDRSLERNLRFLQSTGQNIETYLKSIGKTIEQLREELKPASVKRVAESLVLGKIAEQEKTSVTPAEIDAEIEEMVKRYNGSNKDEFKQALQAKHNRDSIEDTLIARKTLQRLVEIAQSKKETKKEA
ncbi:MAG: trigger factor [Dehalococcoidales bacterium]|nr:trigger factor [Dehalococcoidales bacterium]